MKRSMSRVTKVTWNEMREFIFSQPDERPLDFRDNFIDEPCGCPMIHFAKEHLPAVTNVGTFTFRDSSNIVATTKGWNCFTIHTTAKNYGELKNHLLKEGK